MMRRIVHVLSALFLTCVAATCGPDAGGRLDLRLRILGPPAQTSALRGLVAERGIPPEDMDAFRLCVQQIDGETLACHTFRDLSDRTFRIEEIPSGPDRVVTFQGYATEDGQARWCGRATHVDIHTDETTEVWMLLSRCGAVSQLPETLHSPRVFHTANQLPDGRVAVIGGFDQHADSIDCGNACHVLTATAQIEWYDPLLGTFSQSPTGLAHPRGMHTTVLLSDGRLLAIGGCQQAGLPATFTNPEQPGSPLICLQPGEAATSVEVFDPETESSVTAPIPPTVLPGVMPLGPDRVLLLGGLDATGRPVRRAVLIRMEAGEIRVESFPDALIQARFAPAVIVFSLPNTEPVEAMLVGGTGALDSDDPGIFAERIVFQAGSLFSLVPDFVTEQAGGGLPVIHGTGCRPGPGRILVTGGIYPSRFQSKQMPFEPEPLDAAVSIDMRIDQFSLLAEEDNLTQPRLFHSCTVVDANGNALIAGGFNHRDPDTAMQHTALNSLEWWDAERNALGLCWSGKEPAQMNVARAGHSATLLQDGNVLLLGGMDSVDLQGTAELFNPDPTEVLEDGLPPRY
jgi:hypothetical protein